MRTRSTCAAGLCAGAALLLGACTRSSTALWDEPLYRRVVAEPPEATRAERDQHFAAQLAQGESAPRLSEPLTIESAVRLGLLNHPELRRAGFDVQAAAGRETQAGLLPNPSIGLEFEALGSDAGKGGETTLLVEQEFVTAGKRRKARAVAETDRLAEQAAFRAAAYEVATRIRVAFIATQAAERRLGEFESLLAVAEDLLAAANARVDAGAATEPDRLRAQVVREQARLDAAAARNDLGAARRALAAAMGVEGAIDVPISGDLTALPSMPSEGETIALSLERNAEVEQARIAVERAIRAHALAKAESTPNLFAAVGPRYSDPENETTLDVGLGVEIPLFDRNQGEIAARIAERVGAGAALGAARLRVLTAIADAWATYLTSRESVDAYAASLLPTAERTLELTREGYRAGKTDYLRLLDAQQTVVRARIAYVDALESLHEATATLEGLMQRAPLWSGDPALETTP